MPSTGDSNLAKRARTATGLTQQGFSKKYLIPLGTLRGWEQGVRDPDSGAEMYLRLIVAAPMSIATLIEALPDA